MSRNNTRTIPAQTCRTHNQFTDHEPPTSINPAALALIEAALQYARLDLRVHPVHQLLPDGTCSCRKPNCTRKNQGKHPRLCGWQQQATSEIDRILTWWRRWPQANIGIATGQGLLVLDGDGPEADQSLLDLEHQHGPLPLTARALTGSGGWHRYFRTSFPVGNLVKFLPGLDVRGEGGQVVAPPSTHYSGNSYLWERHPSEGIADCPAWQLEIILHHQQKTVSFTSACGRKQQTAAGLSVTCRTSPVVKEGPAEGGFRPGDRTANPDDVQQLLQDMLDRYPLTSSGMRNDRMTQAVGSLLGRGYSVETTTQVMEEWLKHFQKEMTTDLEAAKLLLNSCIQYTLQSGTFRHCDGTKHQQGCTAIEISLWQQAFLHSALCTAPHPVRPSYRLDFLNQGRLWLLLPVIDDDRCSNCRELSEQVFIRTKGKASRVIPLCKGKREKAFVEAWLVHCLHKILHTKEEVIKATDEQIMAIMKDRCHVTVKEKRTYYHLKTRFIRRQGKPARKLELLKEMKKGHREAGQRVGTPSEYALTGLGWLLWQEFGESYWEEPEETEAFGDEEADEPEDWPAHLHAREESSDEGDDEWLLREHQTRRRISAWKSQRRNST